IVDIAETIRSSSNLNWDWILREAKRHKCLRMCCLGLALAHHLLNAPLPETMLREIHKDESVKALFLWVCDGILTNEGRRFRLIERSWFYMRANDSLVR